MPAPATPVAAVGVAATRSPYWRSGCRQRKVYGESCHCPSDFKFHIEKRNEVLRTTARSRRRDI